jgi:hypothetical protein
MSHRRVDKGSLTASEYEVILLHLKHYRKGPEDVDGTESYRNLLKQVRRAYCSFSIDPIIAKMETRMEKYPNSFV